MSSAAPPATSQPRAIRRVTLHACDHPVAAATVYADRAEVSRVLAKVKVAAHGTPTEVKLRGVATDLHEDSVRVDCAGPALIADVQVQGTWEEVESPAEEAEDAAHAETKAAKRKADVAAKRAELASLEDELADLETDAKMLADEAKQLDAFATSLVAVPPKIHAAGAAGDGVVVPAATAAPFVGDFLPTYAVRATKLARERTRVARRREELGEEMEQVKTWLQQYGDGDGFADKKFETVRSVVIVIEAKKPAAGDATPSAEDVEIDLTITYTVPSVSWTPFYDVRAFTKRATPSVQLTYAARLHHGSADAWRDATVTLSTAAVADTAENGGKPPAFDAPWQVRKRRQVLAMAAPGGGGPMAYAAAPMKKRKGGFGFGGGDERRRESAQPTEVDEEEADDVSDGGDTYAAPPGAAVSAGAVAASYELPTPTTLEPHSGSRRVNVARVDMPAALERRAAPKLAAAAYTVATVENKSEFTLLPGDANVFVDGAFVGKASVPLVLPGASFPMSLGIDPAISVTYKPLAKVTETAKQASGLFGGLFGGGGQESAISGTHLAAGATALHCSRRIVLANKSGAAAGAASSSNGGEQQLATVVVTDQLPLSAHGSIKIALLDPPVPLDDKDKASGSAKGVHVEVYDTVEEAEEADKKRKAAEEKVRADQAAAAASAKPPGAEQQAQQAKKPPQAPAVVRTKYIKELGTVEWTVVLPAAATKELTLAWRVETPKNFTMVGL